MLCNLRLIHELQLASILYRRKLKLLNLKFSLKTNFRVFHLFIKMNTPQRKKVTLKVVLLGEFLNF